MDESISQDGHSTIDAEVLGDLDAWNLRKKGNWYFFEANLPNSDGIRGYRRNVSEQTILADTPGPVMGFLAIGGSRVARGLAETGSFPYHVVAPTDEVGAVGLAGIEKAQPSKAAEALTEQPQIALTAHAYITRRRQNHLGLPLIVARAEHDDSASVAELRAGTAFENLVTAAQSVASIAEALGKRVSVLVVSVDFVLEDVSGKAEAWAADMIEFMRSFEKRVYRLGYSKIHFVSVMENKDPQRIEQQFQLGLFPTEQSFSWLAPVYAFDRDRYCRLTEAGMKKRAQTEAAAISKIIQGEDWICPTLLLAEWDESKCAIRVTTNATKDLVLDEKAFNLSDDSAGFSIEGTTISDVRIDTDNKRDVLISLSNDLLPNAELNYAVNRAGALRDAWTDGAGSHRWALPARLKIGQNPANWPASGIRTPNNLRAGQ